MKKHPARRGGREVRQFQLKLSRHISYQMDRKAFLVAFCFSVGAFIVYEKYFDILAPSAPVGGSIRASFGDYFVVPLILLVSAQTLFTTWLTHVAVATAAPSRKDALKAYFVTSVVVFLYSIYYVLFPSYGPYTFIVYFTPNANFGTTALPILVLWTTTMVLATYMLTKRVFHLEDQPSFGPTRRLLLAATTLAILMMMAD